MINATQFEGRASRSRSQHEGESSYALCDRPSRTRDFSQRQLPTDQDYAVSTREYQTDQSSLKTAPAAAGPAFEQQQKQQQKQKQPHRWAGIDRVTPYQSILAFVIDSRAPSIPRFSAEWVGYLQNSGLHNSRKFSSSPDSKPIADVPKNIYAAFSAKPLFCCWI